MPPGKRWAYVNGELRIGSADNYAGLDRSEQLRAVTAAVIIVLLWRLPRRMRIIGWILFLPQALRTAMELYMFLLFGWLGKAGDRYFDAMAAANGMTRAELERRESANCCEGLVRPDPSSLPRGSRGIAQWFNAGAEWAEKQREQKPTGE